ncbi:MAG TPA: Bax inhibitor-1 family protein [Sphingomonas sp.]|nr:Bax inhibitor-1 family protein [Sphingomonas sp.]
MATIDPFRIRADATPIAQYAAGVYVITASGLILSGFSAALLYSSPSLYGSLFRQTAPTVLGWAAMALPPAIVLVFGRRVARLGAVAAWGLFLSFSAATGMAVAVALAFLTAISSVDIAFLACAFSYLCLALIGWRARCDLSATAKFVLAFIAGLSAAILANLFLRSGVFDLLFAITGVLVFAALAAADTDRVTALFTQREGPSATRAITGALMLYFDLINLPFSVVGASRKRGKTRR